MKSLGTTQSLFPQKIPLQGTDYYHLLFDNPLRRSIGRGNVCHFTITMAGVCTAESLRAHFSSLPWLSWLHSLRLKRSLLRTRPVWQQSNQDTAPVIGAVRPLDIDPQREAPIHWTLSNDATQSFLTLSWHHALLDAHGAELLIRLVGASASQVTPEILLAKEREKSKTDQQLKNFRLGISRLSATPLAGIAPNSTSGTTFSNRIEFSQNDTKAIALSAEKFGSQMFPSCLLIAASARAIQKTLLQNQNAAGDFLVLIPHDDRRRIGFGPLLSNQLTVLFYRLGWHRLATLPDAVAATLESMQESIASGLHRDYGVFMNWLRNVPEAIARRIILHPSRGKMGTFFFSDVGEILSEMDSFLGFPILKAEHIPPFIAPPGISVIASRFRGALTLTIISASHFLSEARVKEMCNALYQDLLS